MDTSRHKKNLDSHLQANPHLRYQRKMHQWTQADLADKLYQLCEPGEREHGIISVGMISSWERGEHLPSSFWQRKLCTLFDTTPDLLGFLADPIFDASDVSFHPQSQQRMVSSRTMYEKLADYLRDQCKHLFDALASGSTYLRMSDILGEQGLFVSPPWEGISWPKRDYDLAEHLVALLSQRRYILLLGEAGQGKTTVLKRVFLQLAERFLQGSPEQTLFPLYLPLRDVSSFTGNVHDLLWQHICDDFPLEQDDFIGLMRGQRVVLLLDGFDEIRGEITQQLVNERASSKLFTYPSLLSCRRSFFDFYLARSPLQERYADHIQLLPLHLTDAVKRSIITFCEQKVRREQQFRAPAPEIIISMLETDQDLRDLAQRPLFLLMLLEVFSSIEEVSGAVWTVNTLYRVYTEQWLKMEAAKPDSILRWHEKATLLQEVAWHTYHGLSQHTTFTYDELLAFIQARQDRYPDKTDTQVADDICFRTLFCLSSGINYTFLHTSFQEYYVARFVFACMKHRELPTWTQAHIEHVLQTSLPFEVATFLKQMLKESTPTEKARIAANLMRVYACNRTDEQRSVTIRQQASHYLTSLGTSAAIAFLEQVCEEESDKWVRRGIMVGLAYYSGRGTMLHRYIQLLRQDQEEMRINLGYHLIYYGDRPPEYGYFLQKTERCEKTLAALFRHLQDKDYQNGQALDILTLSTLLKQQGVSILQEQHWQFLKTFLQQDHTDLGEIFQQEKTQLKLIIEGANVWN